MRPSKFEFTRESWWATYGPNCFRLIGDSLQFKYRWIDDLAFSPTDEQWKALWKTCEVLDIWHLPEQCGNPLIYDGAQFHLAIEWAGRYVRSSGQLADEPDLFRRVKILNDEIEALVPPDMMAAAIQRNEARATEFQREEELEAMEKANRVAKHNEECTALWNRASLGQLECSNCQNRDFRLSESPGSMSLVICNACGWSYPRDDE